MSRFTDLLELAQEQAEELYRDIRHVATNLRSVAELIRDDRKIAEDMARWGDEPISISNEQWEAWGKEVGEEWN
jgi:hypothetical protein